MNAAIFFTPRKSYTGLQNSCASSYPPIPWSVKQPQPTGKDFGWERFNTKRGACVWHFPWRKEVGTAKPLIMKKTEVSANHHFIQDKRTNICSNAYQNTIGNPNQLTYRPTLTHSNQSHHHVGLAQPCSTSSNPLAVLPRCMPSHDSQAPDANTYSEQCWWKHPDNLSYGEITKEK